MKPLIQSGKVWVLQDKRESLLGDIDTDQIFHNAHIHITDPAEMGKYALGNLEGWGDFPKKVLPGDIVITGRNFGAGSSRQQAVDCFISLEVGAIIARSFGAIYFRNAVNSGFPVLTCPNLVELVSQKTLETGDEIQARFDTGEGMNTTKKKAFLFNPMSEVQLAVYRAGSLFSYAKTVDVP